MKQTKAHNGQVTVTAKSYLFLSCQQITVNFGYCTCHLLWYGLTFITFYFPCPNVYRMDLKAPALFLTCVSVSCYMTEPVFITDCPHSETGSSTRKKQWITYTFYTTDWIKVCFYSFEIWGLQFWFFFFFGSRREVLGSNSCNWDQWDFFWTYTALWKPATGSLVP